MKCNYIHIKLKNANNLSLKKKKILDIFKLSFKNDIITLNYNKNKKVSNILEIIYFRKY